MSYRAAVQSLYALGHELAPTHSPRRKFELAHMRTLAAALGDPQDQFPSILIAGTNGKGSTAATLASICRAAGLKTGLYTSPHLVRINERIQINGVQIDDDTFAALYFRVDDAATKLVAEQKLPHPPSFFEVITAIAFAYFAAQKVELAVLEVGLGGRLDATNIVNPLLSIITDIALDHTEYLGPTITDIAREKAGILRQNGVLVTLPQHPQANVAIGEAAVALNVRGVSAADYTPMRRAESSATLRNQYPLQVGDLDIEVDSPLAGDHQQRNLALAIAAVVELRNHHGYNITNTSISKGISSTQWPARLEQFPQANAATILLDVAHNPAGAWSLRSILSALPDDQPRTLIFSCLADKALAEISQILFTLFDHPGAHVILTPVNNPRTASAQDLTAAAAALEIPATTVNSPEDALALARKLTPATGLIVATGSIYLVGEIRRLLTEGAPA